MKARDAHVGNRLRLIKLMQEGANLLDKIRRDAAPVIFFKKPPKPLMSKSGDQPISVTRSASRVESSFVMPISEAILDEGLSSGYGQAAS